MENKPMIDPRLLVEGISKAMLPQDSSITDQELCQALARYLHHNSDEIAMNVIYPQLPLDAPTDGLPSQESHYDAGPSIYDSTAAPDGMPYYGIRPVHVPMSQPPAQMKAAGNFNMDVPMAYASALTEEDCQELISSPYNNLWMFIYNVDQRVLDSFVSKIKLDFLVRRGALLVGDELFTERSYETDQGRVTVQKVATIMTGVPRGLQGPDISVACTSPAGVQTMEIENCAGPGRILQAFNHLEPADYFGHIGCWQNLNVRRDNLMLGTLYDVRQGFGYYQMLMDEYAAASGTRYRQTRSAKKSVGE